MKPKFEYPLEDFTKDLIRFMSQQIFDTSAFAELNKYFKSRYSDSNESEWKMIRVCLARDYLGANASQFEEFLVKSDELEHRGLIQEPLLLALGSFYRRLADENSLPPPVNAIRATARAVRDHTIKPAML